ncbi:lytic transglycosylase domain-containing protein [Acinetobacter sp. R933-2]|uniref:lytic transglycosylase domain-containing protein n=1 Tax=Acinetobacter sp. R933-2 TaxID=2746728 RepID=UPI0025765C59|nr:lytic transglycosylase domain-containing protein [Acinetobacter sp. R933-2]MDM1247104.1 lytic transglycosylase domain-containing protein [Acinetobacter sp. R933-2]
MSNWLSEFSGEDQQQVDTLNATGIAHKPTQQKTPGLWDGAALAVPKGMVAGTIKVIDTAAKPFERIKDHVQYAYDDIEKNGIDGGINVADPSFSEVHEAKNKVRKQELVSEIEQLQDAENTGTIGNIGFSVSDYLTRAVLGSAAGGIGGAVAATGASETNFVYDNLTTKGVDEGTALKVALTDGVIAGGATALPITYGFKGAGGLLADAGLSIGGATGIMTAGQWVSGNILESAGYNQQAKYYEITKEGVATNLILNGLFFSGARGLKHYQQKGLNENVDAEIRSLDADTAVARQDLAEHTLVANELDLDNISTPVRTTDPIQHNNNLVNLDTARSQIESGQPVNVPHNVQGAPKTTVLTASRVASYTNKPWAKTIATEAEKRGIDPINAVVISHIETGGTFDPKIQPKDRNGKLLSSAKGLYQTLDRTFDSMGGGDRWNGNDQIRAGLNYYQHNAKIFKNKFNRDPSGLEVYFMHFFGEGGGPVFLKAGDDELFVNVATRWSKSYKNKKTGRMITAAEQGTSITKSHGFNGMTVGQVKAKYQKRWNDIAKKYGGDGSNIQTVHAMDGTSYDVSYDVKSLGELIASNDTAYGVNPRYPAELQPRDRTREASRQQIESMANDLKPELLGESYKLSDGAPIIGFDNVVESGNGRTLAINRAYETGKAEAYTKFVSDFAAARGLDISGIENPVLVRTRLTDTNRADFAKLANESDVAQFSATERAKTDADRLPDSSLLKINNDGSINLESSMDFVRGFVDQLPQSERATAITPEGRLSQEGKRRIESALVQRTYGDSNLVTRLAENLDEDGKNILNSLLRAAPQLAQLADLVKQGGRHQNTIASDLAQATQKYSDIKASGSNIRDYLDQGQLIDDGLSAGARDFLNVFDSNKRSAKAIGDNIQSKINEVEAMGDPRQGSLFGESPEEKAALEIIANNPNQEITVSRTKPDGEVEEITMTLRERLDELDAEAKAAEQDVLAAQTALSCALQFG